MCRGVGPTKTKIHRSCYESSLEKRRVSTRLCDLFQVPIPAEQKPFHVASKDQRLSQSPNDAQGSPEREQINHERPRWLGNKLVEVGNFLKGFSDHFIGKTVRPLIGSNFC